MTEIIPEFNFIIQMKFKGGGLVLLIIILSHGARSEEFRKTMRMRHDKHNLVQLEEEPDAELILVNNTRLWTMGLMKTRPEACPFSIKDSVMISVTLWSSIKTNRMIDGYHCIRITTLAFNQPDNSHEPVKIKETISKHITARECAPMWNEHKIRTDSH